MFFIPAFPLPSDISKSIHFRIPTVKDCMTLADLNPDLDEAATTVFLNQQQDREQQGGIVHNSQEWTGEDRRTALWWIYLATHEDTTVSYKFVVNGQDKFVDIELKNLGDTATTLSIKPEVPITFMVAGVEHKALVKPLNGHALEEMELTTNQRQSFDVDSTEYRKLSNKLAMQELVYSLVIDSEPTGKEQAEEYRYQLVMNLALDTDFRSLVAEVVAAKRKMQHGLMTSYVDGVYLLVTQVNFEGENGETPIMFPYQNDFFIPTF